MFETTIKWHKKNEELPEKSCTVVAVDFYCGILLGISTVSYSAKHKAFNVADEYSKSECNKKALTGIEYWAYFDEVKAAIKKPSASARNSCRQRHISYTFNARALPSNFL